MRTNYFPRETQSKADPAGAGFAGLVHAVKSLEDSRLFVWRNAWPRVAYLKSDVFFGGCQSNFNASVRFSEFDRVVNKIEVRCVQ